MTTYLDFEAPLKELNEQIEKLRQSSGKTGVDVSKPVKDLEKALKEKTKEIYSGLDPWQRVQVSRHPERPYTLHYINTLTGGVWQELHGDRTVRDDKAMVGGFGIMDGRTVMFIGQQKGINTKMRQYRNSAWPIRKATARRFG
jgi:acetyl-CoA carboxylase carboxyl transferase subunit alpha